YLLGATPFLAAAPLSAGEEQLRPSDGREWARVAEALARRELEVALHGATHQRHSEGVPSEFDPLPFEEARGVMARAWNWLEAEGIPPIAFIPPFNRLPPRLWSALPAGCRILCLGPESLRDVPLLWSPAASDGRVVVYSLRPFYGRAREILAGLERGRWLETEGSIIPITLHWTWELGDGFESVAKLARRLV